MPVPLLLQGSFPYDVRTLRALCADLPTHRDAAALLEEASASPVQGSWSDIERIVARCDGDLPDGVRLARTAHERAEIRDCTSRTQPENRIALAGEVGPRTPIASSSDFVPPFGATFGVATPVAAQVGMTDLTPLESDIARLDQDESRALCASCHDHLADSGVTLTYVDTERWLVCVNESLDVFTERPNAIVGELFQPNLPRGRDGRRVERWMNELQMLLHQHPLNAARATLGRPPINAVWLWGFGRDTETMVKVRDDHLRALRAGDPTAWHSAWSRCIGDMLDSDDMILGDTLPRVRIQRRASASLPRLLRRWRSKPALAQALLSLHTRFTA